MVNLRWSRTGADISGSSKLYSGRAVPTRSVDEEKLLEEADMARMRVGYYLNMYFKSYVHPGSESRHEVRSMPMLAKE